MSRTTDEALYTKLLADGTLGSAGETQDNRWAVISERLYEIVGYWGCEDGKSYDVITVGEAEECYNPQSPEAMAKAGKLINVVMYIDDKTGAATKEFTRMITEALAHY